MSKHHLDTKENHKVSPETPTQFMERHSAWKLILDYCLRHFNKAGFVFLLSLVSAGGLHFNAVHQATQQEHAVTQEQIGLLWHQIHQIQDNLGMKEGQPDSSGKLKVLTNSVDVAKVLIP